jgi:predicted secreted Zn-dependent protease
MTLHGADSGEIVWRASLSCESGACVTVASHENSILLGNSSDPSSPIATYTRTEWKEFVRGIKRGDFDSLT